MPTAPRIAADPRESTPDPPTTSGSRLVSLDFFRGATIAAMILVNNAGDAPNSYWPLKHADWNGWTPTDLIFPFFLFIVGVSMAFSFSSRLKRGESRWQLLRHVFWRGLILFALGLFLNGFPNRYWLSSWRVYGILQRIAICYVVTAIFALWFGRRGWMVAVAGCLAGYWVLMRSVPVPGFGVPTHDIPLLDPDRNLAAWLDRQLLAGHLYDGTHDPEGVLSTIPAMATTLLGLITGDWLLGTRTSKTKIAGMTLFGLVGVGAGEFWNFWFPINKNLWTSSFVLLTAGLALLCLALCYWALDVKHWRGRWTVFFLVFGMNPIVAYVFAEVISHSLYRFSTAAGLSWEDVLYQNRFEPLASPANASFLYAICYVLVCWVAMWALYRKRVFLKI
ncbi:MAG: heparan-alpha-glucosaminide N-acetyltransferase domain-containing protein [Terriglobales bacterium]|jgi:predicted acyltransferase